MNYSELLEALAGDEGVAGVDPPVTLDLLPEPAPDLGPVLLWRALRRPRSRDTIDLPEADLVRWRGRPLLVLDSPAEHVWRFCHNYFHSVGESPVVLLTAVVPAAQTAFEDRCVVLSRRDFSVRPADFGPGLRARRRLSLAGGPRRSRAASVLTQSLWRTWRETAHRLLQSLRPSEVFFSNPRNGRSSAFVLAAEEAGLDTTEILHATPFPGYARLGVRRTIVPQDTWEQSYRKWGYTGVLQACPGLWTAHLESIPRKPHSIVYFDQWTGSRGAGLWGSLFSNPVELLGCWLAEDPRLPVCWRPHPWLPEAERPALPESLSLSEESLEAALGRALVVVGRSSTALFQAAFLGIPTVFLFDEGLARMTPRWNASHVHYLMPEDWPRLPQFLRARGLLPCA